MTFCLISFYLSFNNCGKREIIEEFCEVFPNVWISVLSAAFIVESVNLSDLSAFMVSSENGDSIFMSNLQGYEETDAFNTMVSSVNIISRE